MKESNIIGTSRKENSSIKAIKNSPNPHRHTLSSSNAKQEQKNSDNSTKVFINLLNAQNTSSENSHELCNKFKSSNLNCCGTSLNELDIINEIDDQSAKLKESLTNYLSMKKIDNTQTLKKVNNILINWLRDSPHELEYHKFSTEKKIRYSLRHKERHEAKIKVLESEIQQMMAKQSEIIKQLGDLFSNYEYNELEMDIERLSKSNDIRAGLSNRMSQRLEEMKMMLPIVKEKGELKQSIRSKLQQKINSERINQNINVTLHSLISYLKNIKRKIK